MNKTTKIETKILHSALGSGTILGWYNERYAFVKFPSGTRLINPNKVPSEIIAYTKNRLP